MYTSALLMVGLFVPAVPGSLQWKTDYFAARTHVKERGKPLAVFVGTGQEGWKQICSNGKLTKEANQLLAENYECVYVDASKPQGKRLAADLELADGRGLVISDRTGLLQAFRHEGALTDDDMVQHLKRYADPDHVVLTTETNSVQRASNYFQEPAPRFYSPSYSGGGRSC